MVNLLKTARRKNCVNFEKPVFSTKTYYFIRLWLVESSVIVSLYFILYNM